MVSPAAGPGAHQCLTRPRRPGKVSARTGERYETGPPPRVTGRLDGRPTGGAGPMALAGVVDAGVLRRGTTRCASGEAPECSGHGPGTKPCIRWLDVEDSPGEAAAALQARGLCPAAPRADQGSSCGDMEQTDEPHLPPADQHYEDGKVVHASR